MLNQWPDILADLRQTMTDATYQHLAGSQADPLVDERLTVHVVSEPARAWLANRLRSQIERAAERVIGRPVMIEFVVNGNGPPPQAEKDVTKIVRDDEKGRTDPALAGDPNNNIYSLLDFDFFSAGGGGFLQLPNYASKYWRAYIGAAPFDLWEYIRARFKNSGPAWTSPKEFRGIELAARIGTTVQRVSGVYRGCHRFNKALLDDGEILPGCCGDHEPAPGDWPHQARPSKPFPSGRPMCRYWQHGALEILEAEGLIVYQKHGSGPRSTMYTIQAYQRLPILVPRQAELLRSSHQVEHAGWLREVGQYDAWHKMKEAFTLLAYQISTDNLLLPLPSSGVLSAVARKDNVLRATALKDCRNIIFFPSVSCANDSAGNNSRNFARNEDD